MNFQTGLSEPVRFPLPGGIEPHYFWGLTPEPPDKSMSTSTILKNHFIMNRFVMRNISLTIIAIQLSMGVAFGQFLETNNFEILPAGWTHPTTNFDVKFTSLGESGGVPGPTPQGCDLYGFRAQINTTNSINLGMNAVGFGSLTIPTLTFENGAQQGALDRFWTTNQTGSGCGTLLSFYGQNSGNIVFTLLVRASHPEAFGNLQTET